ncbi:MAG TPA: hypothetical protein VL171_05780 [Verrucomicrobiae bacterium]|nr:hypothetical protein [Verrucomicrobiae bacterium]
MAMVTKQVEIAVYVSNEVCTLGTLMDGDRVLRHRSARGQLVRELRRHGLITFITAGIARVIQALEAAGFNYRQASVLLVEVAEKPSFAATLGAVSLLRASKCCILIRFAPQTAGIFTLFSRSRMTSVRFTFWSRKRYLKIFAP